MRRSVVVLLGATVLSVGVAQIANAADMPTKAPAYAPAPVYNWTGFYGGLNAGGSWGQATNSYNFVTAAGVVGAITNDSSNPNGFIGGGQLGYNWQVNSWVFGLETDIQGSTQSGSSTGAGVLTTCGAGCSVSATDKVTWFGTTRGRIGFASGSWLAYATGGLAYGGVKSNGAESAPVISTTVFPITGGSTTRTGWTLGAGVEAAITGKWTWKIEYLFMDLGTTNFAVPIPPGTPFAAGNITQSMHVTDSIVRAGVNYRFGG